MFICTTSTASFFVCTRQYRFSAYYTRFLFSARDSITSHAAKNSSFVSFNFDRSFVNELSTYYTACIRISSMPLTHVFSISRKPEKQPKHECGGCGSRTHRPLSRSMFSKHFPKPLGIPSKLASNYIRLWLWNETQL